MLFRRIFLVMIASAMGGGLMTTTRSVGAEEKIPSFHKVQESVRTTLSQKAGYRPGDLLSQSEGRKIFENLSKLGWDARDQDIILAAMLPGNHVVVQSLRTRQGRAFMSKVSGYSLIYDRLDRISSQFGGRQLVKDLVRLPDGQRYARRNPGRGVPDLVDLLPKRADGKRPTIRDYDKPTGNIYTEEALLETLKASYAAEAKQRELAARS
jgi:hypothetical protein